MAHQWISLKTYVIDMHYIILESARFVKCLVYKSQNAAVCDTGKVRESAVSRGSRRVLPCGASGFLLRLLTKALDGGMIYTGNLCAIYIIGITYNCGRCPEAWGFRYGSEQKTEKRS